MARIFVVDDDPASRSAIARIVDTDRHDVEEFATGRDALEAVSAAPPDLIVADPVMPGVAGVELLIELDRIAPRVPVIAISSGGDGSGGPVLDETPSAGVAATVGKPFRPQEVRRTVERVLASTATSRAVEEGPTAMSDAATLEVLVEGRIRDVELAHKEVVDRLATVAEYRDDLTGAHQRRVGEMAALIGRRLGLDELLVRRLRMAAPLHDIGKVAIPDAILRKPAPLDHDEWKVMRTHTTVGARMLAGGEYPLLRMAERIALTHHERWDGVGYPEGLKGEDIPLEGRITAVADVIDCMTHPRPYRDALPASDAIAEVERCRGTQFDPEIVPVVLDAWEEGELRRVLDLGGNVPAAD